MIHRESRDRLAVALRHYVVGLITNDDLSEVEVDWRDSGAVAVYQMAWQLYDDNKSHYAKGRHSLTKEQRRHVVRWIAFLYSDSEYLWPEHSLMQIINWPLNLLTFGWWERRKQRRWVEYQEAGDISVWPFTSKAELEEVRKAPRLLSNSGQVRQQSEL